MNLTHAEQSQARKLAEKNPVALKMLEEIRSFDVDPSKLFYREMTETMKTLSKEMKLIRTGMVLGDGEAVDYKDGAEAVDYKDGAEALNIMSEPKTFDMIQKLLVNSEKIFTGLRKGRIDIDPGYSPDDVKKNEDSQVSFPS